MLRIVKLSKISVIYQKIKVISIIKLIKSEQTHSNTVLYYQKHHMSQLANYKRAKLAGDNHVKAMKAHQKLMDIKNTEYLKYQI